MIKDRSGKILTMLVDRFLETGEPVGSRTLSKSDLGVSSATIRNEMADLEEMGYLAKPHTSAGRIPTDKAYRYWVNQQQIERLSAVENDRSRLKDLDEHYLRECRGLEDLLGNTVHILAEVCQLAGVASTPTLSEAKSRIQLIGLDLHHIMAVLVADSGLASSHTLIVENNLSQEELNKISRMFNDGYSRSSVRELVQHRLHSLRSLEKEARNLAWKILQQLEEALVQSETEVFYDGLSRLLSESARFSGSSLELVGSFTGGEFLAPLLRCADQETLVRIGSETELPGLEDYALVAAGYRTRTGEGTIGILGPKRMDYRRVVGVVNDMRRRLEEILG
jgi:heat-inducible transcriptional repressor